MPKVDLSGSRFGRLTVESHAGMVPRGPSKRTSVWNCVCECGNLTVARQEDLRSGNTKSCGCIQREKARDRLHTHGQAKSQIYKLWIQMKQRCFNPNDDKFPQYGARGITVCDRWRDSFEAFVEDMGPRPKGHSLDRTDNDGDYGPDNCRWASSRTQSRNTSKNIWVTHRGQRMVASDFADIMGISSKSLYKAMSKFGLDPHAAAKHVIANRRKT